jgi:hypothetical protein
MACRLLISYHLDRLESKSLRQGAVSNRHGPIWASFAPLVALE